MAETAYLLVFVERATLKITSAGIFSARHVTMNQRFFALSAHEVTAENYDVAQRRLRNTIMAGTGFDWLKPVWQDSTPFRGD